MAQPKWDTIKIRYCTHADCDVGLEAMLVFPAEYLPDTPPRVFAHRCSHAIHCNFSEKPTCMWAGTNPIYDPFTEKE